MGEAAVAIVDIDLKFQRYVSGFLKTRGYAVDTIANGEELLARLNSRYAPCLILLDVMMPDMHGIQILAKIRTSGITVPVIMISGVGLVKPAVDAMKLGASDFLTTPIGETAFETALETIFEENRSDTGKEASLTEGDLNGLVAVNAKMLQLAQIIKRVARTEPMATARMPREE
jgi:two-component system, LuxR family, response regulator FixJ